MYAAKDFRACSNFKYAFSTRQETPIHFVGVWDTVSSFGRFTNFQTLPETRNNRLVKHIRHAVALDERRACFQANLFGREFADQQDIKEEWFPGSHSDVGGGYPEMQSGISKYTLRWMLNDARGLGCRFIDDQVNFFLGELDAEIEQCNPNFYADPHYSIRGFLYNFLEFMPRRYWNHGIEPERMTWRWPNLYRRRKVPQAAVIHEPIEANEA